MLSAASSCYPDSVLTSHGSRSQSQASAFDESSLSESQFVQLTETFLSNDPDYEGMFTKVVQFIKKGYMETEEERMDRLIKVIWLLLVVHIVCQVNVHCNSVLASVIFTSLFDFK